MEEFIEKHLKKEQYNPVKFKFCVAWKVLSTSKTSSLYLFSPLSADNVDKQKGIVLRRATNCQF